MIVGIAVGSAAALAATAGAAVAVSKKRRAGQAAALDAAAQEEARKLESRRKFGERGRGRARWRMPPLAAVAPGTCPRTRRGAGADGCRPALPLPACRRVAQQVNVSAACRRGCRHLRGRGRSSDGARRRPPHPRPSAVGCSAAWRRGLAQPRRSPLAHWQGLRRSAKAHVTRCLALPRCCLLLLNILLHFVCDSSLFFRAARPSTPILQYCRSQSPISLLHTRLRGCRWAHWPTRQLQSCMRPPWYAAHWFHTAPTMMTAVRCAVLLRRHVAPLATAAHQVEAGARGGGRETPAPQRAAGERAQAPRRWV